MMKASPVAMRRGWAGKAFSLPELLVAVLILSLILLILTTISSQVQGLWTNINAEVGQFRAARTGFSTMTQRLSEATLNTYLGYSDGTAGHNFYSTPNFTPKTFLRQSELRFLAGSAATTLSAAPAAVRPTHSVFFEAPLGYTQGNDGNNATLTQMLNVCGYYIEFSSDSSLPTFLTSAVGYQPHYRFRLMELLEPSENNSIYYWTTQQNASDSDNWVTDAFALSPSPIHILADNVIALIVLPQLSANQLNASGSPFNAWDLAPTYLYDSFTTGQASSGGSDAATLDSHNQLPPIVQVAIVAIDEPSAIRLQGAFGTAAPNFGLGSLFQQADKYQADLDQLKANLQQSPFKDGTVTYNPTVFGIPKNINYRVYTTTVSIKGAQWSSLQTD